MKVYLHNFLQIWCSKKNVNVEEETDFHVPQIFLLP